jgi:hypothetical protein
VTDLELLLRRTGVRLAPDATTTAAARARSLAAFGAERPRRRRALLAVAVLAATAAGFGLRRTVVSWFEAEPAPKRVQLSFERLDVGAPPGMETGVVGSEARRVTAVRIGGLRHVLWVAPTKSGGFCEQWTDLFGGCTRDREPPRRLDHGPDFHTFELGVTTQQSARGIVTAIGGRLLAKATERLELRYADAERVDLRVTWVSPPIDAGFYLYPVPARHRRVGHQVSALVALGADGETLAREVFPLPPESEVEHPVRLPDGNVVSLPGKAIVSQARELIDRSAWDGSRLWLWLIPTRDGGRCFVSNRWGGCPPPGSEVDVPMAAGIAGGGLVLFEGQVRSDVADVELHYEDGDVERLEPVDGFVLYDIPKAHYARGHRLVLAIARGRDGTALDRQHYRPDTTGVYPCEKPVDIGLGVKACR